MGISSQQRSPQLDTPSRIFTLELNSVSPGLSPSPSLGSSVGRAAGAACSAVEGPGGVDSPVCRVTRTSNPTRASEGELAGFCSGVSLDPGGLGALAQHSWWGLWAGAWRLPTGDAN